MGEAPVTKQGGGHFCREIVEGSPMGVAFVTEPQHSIQYVNEPFCRLVGKSAQALSGQPFASAAPAGEECIALLSRVIRTRLAEIHTGLEPTDTALLYWSYVMWPVLAVNGSYFGTMIQVMESTESRTRTAAVNQALLIGSVRQHELTEAAEAANVRLVAEIEQRKRAEAELQSQQLELKASEARYRGLMEAIPQIVWTSTPGGPLEFGNERALEYFGRSPESFSERGWDLAVHPEDRNRTQEAWRQGQTAGLPFQIEHRLRDSSTGNFRWFLTRAVPILTDGGAAVQWLGTSTDVDDQKRAELASFNKQKLESLGLLAGGIAHDFNNLLCGILGGASLVAAALPESHGMHGILNDIMNASERAAYLTRQMLAYAGKGRFVIEQVNLPTLIQSTCTLIKASIPSNVELRIENSPNLPAVEADSGQMQQVIMNLVLNAAEAIDEASNGVVTVGASRLELSADTLGTGPVALRHLVPGSYISVVVRDNGCGMDTATQARIFDPFFTTKFTGRGLGLAAVEGIVRSQAGTIDVESALGKGTTFRVYLPVSLQVEHRITLPAEPPLERQGDTVLVVDDDSMVQRVTKLSLENAGFRVRLAGGGEEAMRTLLSQSDGSIALVVLDLRMPGMSGRQVMQQMRGSGIQIPVLISSGYNEREVLAEFSGLNIAGFIQKPFTPRQLADRVSKVLDSERHL